MIDVYKEREIWEREWNEQSKEDSSAVCDSVFTEAAAGWH